jgi:exodeoxyribonuclease VII large subunit
LADVLIVGRGGGSLEDLRPFSEEIVVRAVAASQIPVVSAVGHEIDWAICDFAADLRAPTPSAAAELVSANREETLATVRSLAHSMRQTMRERIEKIRLLAKPFGLEDIEYRFRSILQPRLVRFDDAKEALLSTFGSRIADLRQRLELVKRSLEMGDPAAILERGFSIVTNTETGVIVRSASEVKTGDCLTIHPLEGIINAVVKE